MVARARAEIVRRDRLSVTTSAALHAAYSKQLPELLNSFRKSVPLYRIHFAVRGQCLTEFQA
jgi:hypothetical protein